MDEWEQEKWYIRSVWYFAGIATGAALCLAAELGRKITRNW